MYYFIKQKCGAVYEFHDYRELIIKDGIVYFQARFKERGKYADLIVRLKTIQDTNLDEIKELIDIDLDSEITEK